MATKVLSEHNIDNARLESEVLLKHISGLDLASLHTSAGLELSPEQIDALYDLIQRRINFEPSAYITGCKEFFGIEFRVSPHVLIPRPETELLVEKAIDLAATVYSPTCLIADIGTGCGAIAISIALNLPQSRIYATDISDDALAIAKGNCRYHGVSDKITLLRGHLLEPLPERVDLIVANLPYVKDSDMAELSVEISKFEPYISLAGGADGLRLIEELLIQAGEKLRPNGVILLEIGYDQGQHVREMAAKHYPEGVIRIYSDLNGMERVVSILPGNPTLQTTI